MIFTSNSYVSHIQSSLSYSDSKGVAELKGKNGLQQNFNITKTGDIEFLRIYPVTWNRKYDESKYLKITIEENKTHHLKLRRYIPLKYIRDGTVFTIINDNRNLPLLQDLPKGQYTISFTTNISENEKPIALLLTNKKNKSMENAYFHNHSLDAQMALDVGIRYP